MDNEQIDIIFDKVSSDPELLRTTIDEGILEFIGELTLAKLITLEQLPETAEAVLDVMESSSGIADFLSILRTKEGSSYRMLYILLYMFNLLRFVKNDGSSMPYQNLYPLILCMVRTNDNFKSFDL